MPIDREEVILHMSKVQVAANRDGLIPAFGVFVNQMPAAFWNNFASRLVSRVDPDVLPAAEFLLVNCAHECGYHTGFGIITSEEWNAIVAPYVANVEDVLHGAFAVLTAWGWADAEIAELVPGERMVVRTKAYYEADEGEAGDSGRPSAYMLRGVCAAFMDLAYGGEYDPTGASGLRTFQCEQTKGIECGDEYGEFVVTRAED